MAVMDGLAVIRFSEAVRATSWTFCPSTVSAKVTPATEAVFLNPSSRWFWMKELSAPTMPTLALPAMSFATAFAKKVPISSPALVLSTPTKATLSPSGICASTAITGMPAFLAAVTAGLTPFTSIATRTMPSTFWVM